MVIDAFLDLARSRRSTRRFTDGGVSDEQVRLLVEAAGLAPSNSNRQAWRFLALFDPGARRRLGEAVQARVEEIAERIHDPEQLALFHEYSSYLTFFAEAPLLVIALYKRTPSFLESLRPAAGIPAEGFSVAMAVENLLLAAQALGLGACCTTGPLIASDRLKEILEIPQGWEIGALIPVGAAASPAGAPPKKALSQILEIRR